MMGEASGLAEALLGLEGFGVLEVLRLRRRWRSVLRPPRWCRGARRAGCAPRLRIVWMCSVGIWGSSRIRSE